MYADSLNYSVEAEILLSDSVELINKSRKHDKKADSQNTVITTPYCSCSVAINAAVKGHHAGPDLLSAISLPVYPNGCIYMTILQESRTPETHKQPCRFLMSCTQIHESIHRNAWDMIMLHMKMHRSQAESDELSDTLSLAPVGQTAHLKHKTVPFSALWQSSHQFSESGWKAQSPTQLSIQLSNQDLTMKL